MNKKLIIAIIGVVVVAAIVVVVMCCMKGKDSNEGPKELELTYETNGGVPYEWKYGIENPEVVEFVKQYEIENKNGEGMVGAPIKTNYVFKGLKEGTTTITFKYVSIVDGSVDKEEKHTVKVDKNKNISLVGLK